MADEWTPEELESMDQTARETERQWMAEHERPDLIAGTITEHGPGYVVVTEIGTGTEHRLAVQEPIMRRLARERLDGARAQQTVGDVAIMTGDANKVNEVYDQTFAYLAVAQDEPEDAWETTERNFVLDLAATYLRWKELHRG